MQPPAARAAPYPYRIASYRIGSSLMPAAHALLARHVRVCEKDCSLSLHPARPRFPDGSHPFDCRQSVIADPAPLLPAWTTPEKGPDVILAHIGRISAGAHTQRPADAVPTPTSTSQGPYLSKDVRV